MLIIQKNLNLFQNNMNINKSNIDAKITGGSDNFYPLIDRLQKHSEWKYPDRKWSIDIYYNIAWQWIGKEKELEERVLKLEAEMKSAIESQNN